MSVTFDVSPVASSTKQLATTGARRAMTMRIGTRPEASAANHARLLGREMHPFVDAVQLAFNEHLPLVISPDDVWLCIAQGFAHHVDVNAEALRERFVRHQGQAKIVVVRHDYVKGSSENDWPSSFAEFSDSIAKHIGKQRELIVANFSTTGPVERAASEIVLMSAMNRYFKYIEVTRCGIPRITLLGTLDDWNSIKQRASHLAEYGLETWTAALGPVLSQFCAAAAGNHDVAMWQSFFSLESRSGGDQATGWINTLFPFVRNSYTNKIEPNGAATKWHLDNHGPTLNMFPSGLAIAPFSWIYENQVFPMEFVAGFAGVSQGDDFAVRPAIGWAVRDQPNSRSLSAHSARSSVDRG